MGGDHAPQAILAGVVGALDRLEPDDHLVLVGDEGAIREHLAGADLAGDDRLTIIGTSEVVGMAEPPVEAVRGKPDSSINVLAELATEKKSAKRSQAKLDVVISAGNTGAFVSAAQMHMRRLRGVHRPGIAVAVPTFAGPVVLIDVGANIEPKPHHLAQYGVMGEIYARTILGIEEPRVALMNVGGEEQKGTAEMKQARELLAMAEGANFKGYIEGRGVFDGDADVVITDGVVGNVMIKLAEGLSAGIFKAIGREVMRIDPELAKRFQPVVQEIYAQHDYHEYGGAPLLGVNGVAIIAHGSSEARTITNAILRSREIVERRVNEVITRQLAEMEATTA